MGEPVDTSAEAVERVALTLGRLDGDGKSYTLDKLYEAADLLRAMSRELQSLRAQCARVQRDAERYRFLRDSADRDDDGCPFIALNVWSGLSEDDDPDFLDCDTQWLTGTSAETAIDAAMAAKEAG